MREARITLDEGEFDSLGIGELVTRFRRAGIQAFDELACHGKGAVIQVEVGAPLGEEALDDLDYVDDWDHVATEDGNHLYVVAFTAPTLSDGITEHTEELVGTCDPGVGDRGATLSLVGPQRAIAGTISGYREDGINPELRKLGPYEGRDSPLDRLTDRQREVIQTAFDLGYYEVPRAASTAAVADELDLDPSTVTEHLQRAERNLLGAHLADE